MKIYSQPPLYTVLLAGILMLAAMAYWPGLTGSFLFDDFANLDALNAPGPVDNIDAFWRYLTSGHADPTGRPLTLLTFLIDANHWPTDPLPFKRTNLLLHLFNGYLLFELLSALGELAGGTTRRARKAALFGMACWLLHPLLVSTTLYVVQREAMLSTTLVMMGLICWLRGRQQLVFGKLRSGTGWCLVGLIGGTVLGLLAKANGVLLPVLILVIESCFPFCGTPTAGRRQYQLKALAGTAATTLVAYLTWQGIRGLARGGLIDGRNWSLAQRLLTEPRVLWDYLTLLWLPRPFSTGLFNDSYPVSISWHQPWTTLPALLGLIALLACAWYTRKRWPVLAVAVLFYFAAQLLESTTIPLELYYEHRNYLPALIMFWPLAWWLAGTQGKRIVKLCVLAIIPLALACLSFTRSVEWGHPLTQALLWASENPASSRAQAWAATVELQDGQVSRAILRLQKARAANPDDPPLALNLIDAYCHTGAVPASILRDAANALNHTRQRGSFYSTWFGNAIDTAATGQCNGLNAASLNTLLASALANPALAAPGLTQDLQYAQARLALAENNPAQALATLQKALAVQPRPDFALSSAALLGQSGHPEMGLQLLDGYQRNASQESLPDPGMPHLHAWVLQRQDYWPREMANLRSELLHDQQTRHAMPHSFQHP